MITVKLDNLTNNNGAFIEDFKNILSLAEGLCIHRLLCINPRDGVLPLALHKKNDSIIIDSFVSDNEWLSAAGGFSEQVISGHSHHALDAISSDTYDAILVCEDFAQVDDVDRMATAYYRLLKPGGVLLGSVWNMRYHKHLHCLLHGEPLPQTQSKEPLHGSSSIVMDSLYMRLNEIGFSPITVYGLYGEVADVSEYVKISVSNGEPADDSYFLTKQYFFKAGKL